MNLIKITELSTKFDHKSENIAFHQPIFHDRYVIPGKGSIIPGEYNRLTWIIGQKTLAVL